MIFDGDGGAAGDFINGGGQDLDGGFLIAGFLVKLLHVLGVVEKFVQSKGWPILEVSFFLRFCSG